MLISIRMIASVPYANKNGVSPVRTHLVVLRPRALRGVSRPICPLLYPKLLHVKDGMIVDLRLIIALRIIWHGESVTYT